MKTILLGTTNQGKIKEFTQALIDLPIKIENLNTLKLNFQPEENGETFEENALSKAKAWAEKTSLPTLVDDSGLSVDILNGEPGVHSHRFFQGSDQDRNQYLLKLLEKNPADDRTARYICALVFYDPFNKKSHTTLGSCEGKIGFNPKGSHGFGYDPIFYPIGYGKTFGELPDIIKAKLSHRAKALTAMIPYLKQWSQN
jgi:XTP/dITP diphosphohydrolase